MANEVSGTTPSRGNLGDISFGLGLLAVVTWIVAAIVNAEEERYGWLWFVMAAFAVAALITGLMAGRGRPRGRALIGTVLGGLLFLLFMLFAVGILQ